MSAIQRETQAAIQNRFAELIKAKGYKNYGDLEYWYCYGKWLQLDGSNYTAKCLRDLADVLDQIEKEFVLTKDS